MAATKESHLEAYMVEGLLTEQGFCPRGSEWASPDREQPLRDSYRKVLLEPVLWEALKGLNPQMPTEALGQAIDKLKRRELPGPIEENARIHHLLVDGIPVLVQENGESKGDVARVIDWETADNNTFDAVRQFTVIGEEERRPDTVLFINGIPLVACELKGVESDSGIEQAYNQIQTYKQDIPELFRFNLLSIISDGVLARYGSISADFDRFMPWRTLDGKDYHPPGGGSFELDILVQGLCRPDVLLRLMRYACGFHDSGKGRIKVVAGYHQFHAMEKALEAALEAMRTDGRAGVMWHTQGSGKSFLMSFLAGRLITHPETENPTILVLTDRNDLDSQLFDTFADAQDLLRQAPIATESTDELRELLNRATGGVIFSTIQKFQPRGDEAEFPLLTDRSNVFVFVDEAHRTQYGFDARVDQRTGRIRYGLAHYLRQGIPNAVFVGFTGTPVELIGRNTKDVFGEYIDIYDIKQAVDDGATVPVHYEARIARLETEMSPEELEAEYEAITEGLDDQERERLGKRYSRLERLLAAPKRLDRICEDFLEHRAKRLQGTDGKVMFVAASREIAVEMYDRIVDIHPEWASKRDDEGVIKVVMTGSASDPEHLRPHIRTKSQLNALRLRYQDPEDPFSIVIVVDMWLTGFDAPCLHTLYVDKPLKGHGLMQAIARTNRVYGNKKAGLVVDYIGIGTELRDALRFYTQEDRNETGVSLDEIKAAFLTQLQVMRDIFHGFDYQPVLNGSPEERMRLIPRAVEYVYGLETAKDDESEEDRRKRSIERFLEANGKLQAAFKVAITTDEAQRAKNEVSFFLAVQKVLKKLSATGTHGQTTRERDAAIDQLVDEFIASTEVVDILAASGFDQPDLSVLDDTFLERFRKAKNKDFVLEALRRILNDQIQVKLGDNITVSKQFSERLAEAMKRYHNRSVDSIQIIQELIAMAKELAETDDDELSREERAFYAALAEFDKAAEVVGSDELKLLAAELVCTVQSEAGVDWWSKKQARARLRRSVKRLLNKHGWPPEFSQDAVRRIVEQAEVLASKANTARA